MDSQTALDVIERMKLARIGEYEKWERMAAKIRRGQELNPAETAYYARLTRIYKDPGTSGRTRIYHTALSEHDQRPPCRTCGGESLYYCNMNDAYFCPVHVVGHDENER